MAYSLNLYRRARQTLRDSLRLLPEVGMKRIALHGTGEAAELAYITLKEFGLEPVGVFSREPGEVFLGLSVRPIADLATEEVDAIVLATFEPPEPYLAELTGLGVEAKKVLTLRRPAPSPRGNGGAA